MLTHSQARSIAEAEWGTGGTHSEKTNRRGAFYFSCSSHGGFVIDSRALTPLENSTLQQFGCHSDATQYGNHGVMHQWRRKKISYTLSVLVEKFQIYLFEEDCAWCLPVKFADILVPSNPTMTPVEAELCHYNLYNTLNPKVAARIMQSQAREAKDPRLVIWANQHNVGTADGKTHPIPVGYDYLNPWMPA